MIVNDYTPIDEKRSKIGKREGKRNCEIKRESGRGTRAVGHTYYYLDAPVSFPSWKLHIPRNERAETCANVLFIPWLPLPAAVSKRPVLLKV